MRIVSLISESAASQISKRSAIRDFNGALHGLKTRVTGIGITAGRYIGHPAKPAVSKQRADNPRVDRQTHVTAEAAVEAVNR
ncbi:MAG TPA: hypothetical protein VG269_18030 [Tepidisphaeraceae bacterium]|nr:hypothetical protein [Tepidisphaeraceae bacterium]